MTVIITKDQFHKIKDNYKLYKCLNCGANNLAEIGIIDSFTPQEEYIHSFIKYKCDRCNMFSRGANFTIKEKVNNIY